MQFVSLFGEVENPPATVDSFDLRCANVYDGNSDESQISSLWIDTIARFTIRLSVVLPSETAYGPVNDKRSRPPGGAHASVPLRSNLTLVRNNRTSVEPSPGT